jgi:hypothetical protein
MVESTTTSLLDSAVVHLLWLTMRWVTDIGDDNGIDVLLDEDSPGLATSLSTSIVIDLNDKAEFEANLADGTQLPCAFFG